MEPRFPLYIVLARPPGPESDFVEIEDKDGKSVRVGQWYRRGNFWVLRIDAPRVDDGESALTDVYEPEDIGDYEPMVESESRLRLVPESESTTCESTVITVRGGEEEVGS